MKLKNKFALITGGTRGLGKVITQFYLREGASVLFCGRDAKKVCQLEAEFNRNLASNQKLIGQTVDLADKEQIDQWIEKAYQLFPHVDILVNNAGTQGPKGFFEDSDWADWTDTIQVDLLAPVYLCKKLLPHFKKRGKGKIINLSGGGSTSPRPRMTAYAVSKCGLVRFTETLAEETREWAIDINAVAPGALNTRMLDEILEAGSEKVGETEYLKAKEQKAQGGVPLEKGAELAVFLASDASDGITGKLISAVWDPWRDFPKHLDELSGSDIYTLRRILPEERGMDWASVES